MIVRYIKFSFIIVICTITKEIHSIPSLRMDDETTKNPITDKFTELLDSLVKVNENRMEALNKFLELNNFYAIKNIQLRTSEDNGRPKLAMFIMGRNEDSGKVHQASPGLSKKPKSDSDSDSDSSSSSSSSSSSKSEESKKSEKAVLFVDSNLRMNKAKDESSFESGHVVMSTENKNPLNIKNDILLSDSESSERTLATKKAKGRLSRGSVRASRSLTYCVVACKAAYRHACTYHGCSRSLYMRLRRECNSECRRRFQ